MNKSSQRKAIVRTAIKVAIPHPLTLACWYISAKIPGPSATGELPNIPVKSLNTRNELQFGATAQDNVKSVKIAKVAIIINRRPNSSLSGAHTIGPFCKSVRYP